MCTGRHPPTDMRRWRKQEENRLLMLALLVLVVVGGGLIGIFFGPGTLWTALPCLFGGAAIILGLWLLLNVVERWLNNR